jgi:hypothetical protein
MNGSNFVIANDKKYQNVELTFLNLYRGDLTAFGSRIY